MSWWEIILYGFLAGHFVGSTLNGWQRKKNEKLQKDLHALDAQIIEELKKELAMSRGAYLGLMMFDHEYITGNPVNPGGKRGHLPS